MTEAADESSVRYLTSTLPTWWLTVRSSPSCRRCPTWSVRDHKNLWIPTTIRTSCSHQPPIWSQSLQFLHGRQQLKNPGECKTRPFLPRFLQLLHLDLVHLLQLHLLHLLPLHQAARCPGERSGRSLRNVTVVVSRSSVYRWEIWQNTRPAKIAAVIFVVNNVYTMNGSLLQTTSTQTEGNNISELSNTGSMYYLSW